MKLLGLRSVLACCHAVLAVFTLTPSNRSNKTSTRFSGRSILKYDLRVSIEHASLRVVPSTYPPSFEALLSGNLYLPEMLGGQSNNQLSEALAPYTNPPPLQPFELGLLTDAEASSTQENQQQKESSISEESQSDQS
jgi:hypothetical protein